jgi:phospholipid transport system substrate-binding protein
MFFARILIVLVVLGLGSGAGRASASESAGGAQTGALANPRAVVESLHSVLLECMKGACGAGFDSRFDRIVSQLDKSFDLPFMARISIGKAWSALSAEERATFVELSRDLSASNYAVNFESYGGQRFETLAEEPAGRGTILVKTEFVQPSDDNVKFDYRLRQSGESWRIIDVTLDGKVSEITMRRADYRSVIERKGFPTLVDKLEKKLAKLADEPAP